MYRGCGESFFLIGIYLRSTCTIMLPAGFGKISWRRNCCPTNPADQVKRSKIPPALRGRRGPGMLGESVRKQSKRCAETARLLSSLHWTIFVNMCLLLHGRMLGMLSCNIGSTSSTPKLSLGAASVRKKTGLVLQKITKVQQVVRESHSPTFTGPRAATNLRRLL